MKALHKKILPLFLLAALLLTSTVFSFAKDETAAKIILDGYPVTFQVAPMMENNRVFVPFRPVAEALNIKVTWDNALQTVTATNNETTVKLQIGNLTATKNETNITLDSAPKIVSGSTMIPLRFFAEAFSCKVEWNCDLYAAIITSPLKNMDVTGFYALGNSESSSWSDLFAASYPSHTPTNTKYIDTVALGWYSVDANGNLLKKSSTGWQQPDGWETVLKTADQYQLNTEMVVHGLDGNLALTQLISSQTAIENIAQNIANEITLYDGVNLDLEGLGLSQTGQDLINVQNQFTALAKSIKDNIGSEKTLTLTLHAPNSSYKGYDYKALGAIADQIMIMAYDYGTKPEPEALVVQAITQALENVPKEKLSLGISLPSETSQSLKTKIGLAKRYDLNGVAFWRLGLFNQEAWNSLFESVLPRI